MLGTSVNVRASGSVPAPRKFSSRVSLRTFFLRHASLRNVLSRASPRKVTSSRSLRNFTVPRESA